MKRNKGILGALVAYVILWGVLLLVAVVEMVTFLHTPADTDIPLGHLLEKGFRISGIVAAAIGVVNGLQLFFSVRRVCRPASAQAKAQSKVALWLSAAATGSFYALLVLLFGINKDELFAVYLALAFLWLVCTVAGGVVLLIPQKKKSTADD